MVASSKPAAPARRYCPEALQKDERGLFEAAVGDDGLADQSRLPIEVVEAPARKREVRVGFKLHRGRGVRGPGQPADGELIFKREEDHADGGDYLADDNDANERDADLVVEEAEGKCFTDVGGPGNKAERWQGRCRVSIAGIRKRPAAP